MTSAIASPVIWIMATAFTLTDGNEYIAFGDTYQDYEICMKQAELQNRAMAEDIAACTGGTCVLKKAVADCVNVDDIEEVVEPEEIQWSKR